MFDVLYLLNNIFHLILFDNYFKLYKYKIIILSLARVVNN